MELARRGAEHRYRELKAELAVLIKHFPHLRESIGGTLPVAEEAVKRNRRRMSAAARRAVSERMKKFWAARRKAKQAAKR